ncbi:PKD domain-containing protein [Flavobacterium litorale]|uniref:PKD domain-containing protein n=1 Tax=Flavobacterium litorale TaxID=2856519 RepID=A0ABX8V7N1_9FLAO|nr:PKD domain-containing protein [Flavobacterium litorale]QYJ68825.1 PKD domain-containing protein [Flavobacterium litorale]
MKKNYTILIIVTLCLCTQILQAQTWQWAKKGGSFDDVQDKEKVESMITDTDGNLYILAHVGETNLEIDGVSKTAFGNPDYMIASFDCEGTYRWSSIIGGAGFERVARLQTDAQNNIYVAGTLQRTSEVMFGGETDTTYTLPYSTQNNQHKQNLFLAKYNSDGVFQWVTLPQADDVTQIDAQGHSITKDFQVDAEGNAYWLCTLPQGTYANGAFENTTEGDNLFVLQYNTSGAFVSANPLDMQTIGFGPIFKMVQNHTTGTLYIGGYLPFGATAPVIGGSTVNSFMFLAAFDATGTYLWKHENSHEFDGVIEDMYVDATNNLYVTGGTSNGDTFAGATFNSENLGTFPFILKLSATGELIWSTNATTSNSSTRTSSIVASTTEVGVVAGHGNINWDGELLSIENNSGYDVMLGKFNANDGSIIGLYTLGSNFGAIDDGTAVATDNLGNFYVGGRFQGQLFVNDETLVNGAQGWDFFFAKHGTDNCDCALPEPDFGFAPNDANGGIFSFNYSGTEPYDTISWSFGDGASSDEENPTHAYATPNTYTVCVTVTNACGSNQYCDEVTATPLHTDNFTNEIFSVYPNPSKDLFTITATQTLQYKLYSVLGAEVATGYFYKGENKLSTITFANACYLLKVTSTNGTTITVRLLKM